jgi:anti-sigma-K factor RskA
MVRAEGAEQARRLTLLQDPDTRIVSLDGLPPSPEARARMLWNPRTGGLLVTAALPPVPEGKVYELWAIAAGKPVPAGLFGVDPSGRATVPVGLLAGVDQVDVFAVTLEPAGGVPAPTGPMYLASRSA